MKNPDLHPRKGKNENKPNITTKEMQLTEQKHKKRIYLDSTSSGKS